MQCLNCVAPLVKYFTESVNPRSVQSLGVSAGGLAVALGSAFEQMRAEGGGPIALYAFRKSVGNLYPPFLGCEQQDSHEFLMFLLSWLHEDLEGGVNREDANALNHLPKDILNNRTSIIFSRLFQGEHMQSIVCCNCHHNSVSMEAFTVLSLSISTNMECTLMSLFDNHYQDGIIDIRCPKCNIAVKSVRKTKIQKLPQILVLHLNHFEYATQANKWQTYVDFPLQQLNLQRYFENFPPYNLIAVTNHYGTVSGDHYTSHCKLSQGDIWYSCDNSTVKELRTCVNTSAAYMLFYECQK